MEANLDLYTDYLLSSFGKATATGLSNLLDGAVSHDKVSRFLSVPTRGGKDLWLEVKPLVREHQTDDGCLIFDDSIQDKTYTDENGIICWHWDHSKGRNIKGINLFTAFYHTRAPDNSLPLCVPVDYRLVVKDVHYSDLKTQKEKRTSSVTKNELMREMIQQSIDNQIPFGYVLADSWFASRENMLFINRKGKFFIFDMKANRKAALTQAFRNKGEWTKIDSLDLPKETPVKVWLKDLAIPVLVVRQVFINKDGSTGERFLVSNDYSLSAEDFKTLYKKRWSVEAFHKSIKQNAGSQESPTKTVRTQSKHLFAVLVAYIKLEKLKFAQNMNHFALKSKLYLTAIKAAFTELTKLKDELDKKPFVIV